MFVNTMSDPGTHVVAVIVAAGSGKRFGSSVKKQFHLLLEKPVLYRTLERFQLHPAVDSMICVVAQADRAIVSKWNFPKLISVVGGGQERHDSVYAALTQMDSEVDIVLIHDGVRPLISEKTISLVIKAAIVHGAAFPGLVPKDTIKQIDSGRVKRTLPRDELVLVQTPQAFQRAIILRAYDQAFQSGIFSTDDAALVEKLDLPVAVVPGQADNIKITTPEDLCFAETMLKGSPK